MVSSDCDFENLGKKCFKGNRTMSLMIKYMAFGVVDSSFSLFSLYTTSKPVASVEDLLIRKKSLGSSALIDQLDNVSKRIATVSGMICVGYERR